MPQIYGHCDISHYFMLFMSVIVQYEQNQPRNQSVSLVERETKNPDSTSVTALDMVGLTWIFTDDEFLIFKEFS